MTPLLRALLSHYRRHPVQALFLLTGIVVANVLLVGTLLINAQARASYERGETLLRAGPVGEVRPRDGSRPIDEREYLRLRLQGFDMLVPALRQVVQAGNGERLELLGIDLFAMPRSGGRARGGADSGRGQANHGFAGFAFPPWQLWAAPGRIEIYGPAGNRVGGFAAGESGKPADVTAVKTFRDAVLVADASARLVRERPEVVRALVRAGLQCAGVAPVRLSGRVGGRRPAARRAAQRSPCLCSRLFPGHGRSRPATPRRDRRRRSC